MVRESERDTWHWLTAREEKRALYARDPYFREAWHDARAVLGPQAEAILPRIAIVVFKPETVVTRRIEAALDFLSERGFVPLLSREIHYTRPMNRAAWRYQYQDDLPTVDRLTVNDLQFAATPALAVIFYDREATAGQSASARLNTFKGSMTPALRSGNDLRSLVGGPNRMLSGVHAPDEAADVIREIGILFDTDTRFALFAEIRESIAREAIRDVHAAARALMDRYQPVVLDPDAALTRLEATIRDRADDGGNGMAELQHIVTAVRRGEPLPWQPFRAALRDAGIDLPLWDLILIGTEFIRHTEEASANAATPTDSAGASH